MGIFSKKTTFALSEILKGLQQAVSSAAGMLQAQQMDNLTRFWEQDGKPVTQTVQLGERELEVPIMALVYRPSGCCHPTVMNIRIFESCKGLKNNEV